MFSRFGCGSKVFVSSALTVALFGLSACAVPATVDPVADLDVPERSLDGLDLVSQSRDGFIYADPNVDWSVYDSILLDPARVSFRKNWQRDQNRDQPFSIRADDMERIKTGLAELFDEVFTEELTENGGYEITAQTGDDVLRITPNIVDLDVYAPDIATAARTEQYSESAGRMTLKLELYDSVTGDLIALASDRQEDPRLGWMEWRTRVSNRADAERMLQRWASRLRERLDQARREDAAAG